jgi:flagellar hook-length control protein FliK
LPEIAEQVPAAPPQAPLKADAKQKSTASAALNAGTEGADSASAATPQGEDTQPRQTDAHHNKARANAPALQEAAATQHRSPAADKAADTDIKPLQQTAAAPNTDPTQSATLPTLHVHATASAVVSAGAAAPLANAIPVAGVAVEIAAQARAGNTRFEIRLDPPELGRIDVRLDVDRHGHVTSRLLVDRPETLDMLRRDAASLERALQDAGLKTSDNALNFSLRDQSGGQQGHPHADRAAAHIVVQDDTLAATSALQNYDRSIRLGGLDIRV